MVSSRAAKSNAGSAHPGAIPKGQPPTSLTSDPPGATVPAQGQGANSHKEPCITIHANKADQTG